MSSNQPKITEGYMPFLDYKVYYRIVGEKQDNNKKPLLLLHGGPGSTHNYFEILDKLSILDNRQLIMYDQIGCGNSYVEGHPELWTLKTWIDELKEIRKHLNLNELHILEFVLSFSSEISTSEKSNSFFFDFLNSVLLLIFLSFLFLFFFFLIIISLL